MMKKKYSSITFRTRSEVKDELQKRAFQENRSLSNYINNLINKAFDKKLEVSVTKIM